MTTPLLTTLLRTASIEKTARAWEPPGGRGDPQIPDYPHPLLRKACESSSTCADLDAKQEIAQRMLRRLRIRVPRARRAVARWGLFSATDGVVKRMATEVPSREDPFSTALAATAFAASFSPEVRLEPYGHAWLWGPSCTATAPRWMCAPIGMYDIVFHNILTKGGGECLDDRQGGLVKRAQS